MSERTQTLLTPEQLEPSIALVRKVLEQLDRILLGRAALHRMVVIGLLSRGHILLEGLPGLGKTALIRAIGRILRLEFKRVQFTPDLMPGDILGTHILQTAADGRREMVFQPGPVFTNILLADEINRASPKTQSAMLETMQERSVTLLGTTRQLPRPFFVLASQNPIELEGTYPLPEAQVDRFLFKLMTGQVETPVLESIISSRRHGEPPEPTWTMSAEELAQVTASVDGIFLPKPVARYIARLVNATHPGGAGVPDAVASYVTYGASPRAAIGMAEAARACALTLGRPTVGFEDVKEVAAAVLNHRMILNYKAQFDKVDSFAVVDAVMKHVDNADLDLPAAVKVEKP